VLVLWCRLVGCPKPCSPAGRRADMAESGRERRRREEGDDEWDRDVSESERAGARQASAGLGRATGPVASARAGA
jgi:hypothetical protein